MLRYRLLHPQILESLSSAGHGTQILLADSNYPFSTGANPSAKRVYLNLAPGLINLTDTLGVLLDAVSVEAVHAIHPDSDQTPPIFETYQQLMPELEIQKLGRFPFYEAAKSSNVGLVIATGEQRTWACLLLTLGVIETQ